MKRRGRRKILPRCGLKHIQRYNCSGQHATASYTYVQIGRFVNVPRHTVHQENIQPS